MATQENESIDAEDSTDARDLGIREQRVEHIADLMRTCRWYRGTTGKALAKEWGLKVQTVKLYAAQASKRVYAEVMSDREAVGEKIGAALGVAIEGAIQDRDWRALSGLAKVYADATGVSAPIKTELAVVSDVSQLAHELGEVARRMAGGTAGAATSDATVAPDGGGSESAAVELAGLLGKAEADPTER